MEQQDQDSRTEDATGKRIAEAKKEGRLPISQEVRTWFMMTAGYAVLLMVAPMMGRQMMEALPVFFGMADQLHADDGGLRAALLAAFHIMLPGLAAAGGILFIAAILGTIVQTGPYAEPSLLGVKWERMSLISGWRRLFNTQSIIEMVKGILKLSIVMYVMYRIIKPLTLKSEYFIGMHPALQSEMIYTTSKHMMGVAILFLTLYAAIDWYYQRRRWKEALKMTKQEVKDEHKQSEGDPVARNRLRRLRLERARRRMMAKVPEADVVITNPTHYAVALEYKPQSMRAPRVIAKGQDMIALKIRDVATGADVPIVENPPLARALHASCEVDDEIPVEHYQAVAEIISYVYKLKKKTVRP